MLAALATIAACEDSRRTVPGPNDPIARADASTSSTADAAPIGFADAMGFADALPLAPGEDARPFFDASQPNPGDDAAIVIPPAADGGAPVIAPDASGPASDAGGPPPGGSAHGAACASGPACAGGTCITGQQSWWDDPFTGGYCTATACMSGSCGAGAECFITDEATNATTCFETCMVAADCRPGYACFEPGACLPDPNPMPPTGSPIGGACTASADCAGTGASCLTTFPQGYCIIRNCSAASPCPNGADCFTVDAMGGTACLASCAPPGPAPCRSGYACVDAGACFPACTANSCAMGEVCSSRGTCEPASCTPQSCAMGTRCDMGSGQCVTDLGTPPPGPVPACANLPSWQCAGTEAFCGQILPFDPVTGPGYWNYPINGETANNQYRSFARRDMILLIKYAAAAVECLSAGWSFGNRQPLGLGDMSESNGAIPGTSINSPGHPAGTHVNGHDMDLAYFQVVAADNRLREVCPHITNGQDQLHCTAPPTDLDIWRSALFIGLLHSTPQLRVIGVDGQIGPMVESAVTQLCSGGWLNNDACNGGLSLAYETTDMGRGWFLFHLHHLHVSITNTGRPFWTPPMCLTPACDGVRHDIMQSLQPTRPILPLGHSL